MMSLNEEFGSRTPYLEIEELRKARVGGRNSNNSSRFAPCCVATQRGRAKPSWLEKTEPRLKCTESLDQILMKI